MGICIKLKIILLSSLWTFQNFFWCYSSNSFCRFTLLSIFFCSGGLQKALLLLLFIFRWKSKRKVNDILKQGEPNMECRIWLKRWRKKNARQIIRKIEFIDGRRQKKYMRKYKNQATENSYEQYEPNGGICCQIDGNLLLFNLKFRNSFFFVLVLFT